jgi:hypothetical protein
VLGLSPYSAVGDIGNRRFIVTVSAILYSLGMVMLNVGVLAYGILGMTNLEMSVILIKI